MDVQDVV